MTLLDQLQAQTRNDWARMCIACDANSIDDIRMVLMRPVLDVLYDHFMVRYMSSNPHALNCALGTGSRGHDKLATIALNHIDREVELLRGQK